MILIKKNFRDIEFYTEIINMKVNWKIKVIFICTSKTKEAMKWNKEKIRLFYCKISYLFFNIITVDILIYLLIFFNKFFHLFLMKNSVDLTDKENHCFDFIVLKMNMFECSFKFWKKWKGRSNKSILK